MSSNVKKAFLVITAFVLNVFAVGLTIAFSKTLLNYTGWIIVSTEIFPLLLCGLAFYFLMRKDTLPLVWGLVIHSFILFETLSNIEYLFNVPMIKEEMSPAVAFLIGASFFVIFILSIRKLLKFHNWKFITTVIVFFWT